MSPAHQRPPASKNLIETYERLARAIPGTRFEHGTGYRYCIGPYPHPICNFVLDLHMIPNQLQSLVELVAGVPAMTVVHLPGDSPTNLAALLERAGFEVSHRLVQMMRSPGSVKPEAHVRFVTDLHERLTIGRFMSDQFFSAQTTAFRRRLADATASADVELLCLGECSDTHAAAMVCDDGDTLGLYNVCVDPPRQGRGVGSSLVRWCCAHADTHQRHLTLQCSTTLAHWYAKFGFVAVGDVRIYRLSNDGHGAIMQLV